MNSTRRFCSASSLICSWRLPRLVGSAQFATSWLTGEQRDRERREHRDYGDGEKGGVSFGVSPGDTT
jgi:hypothetical protein